MAFLRVSESQIYLRERIDKPDVVVVLDPTLIGLPEVTDGLAYGKTLVINATENQRQEFIEVGRHYRLGFVDASRIAMEYIGLPITNTAIIGALVKATEILSPDTLKAPFENRFGRLAEKNLNAMQSAYEQIEFIAPLAPEEHETKEKVIDYQEYIKGEALYPWPEVEIGCDVHIPGNSKEFFTGNWRTGGYPLMDEEKCISCGICWIMCPEMAFEKSPDCYRWSGEYCKGCGICVTTCPKKALSMEEEK